MGFKTGRLVLKRATGCKTGQVLNRAVTYTQCLRYNICSAWLLDIRISTCLHYAMLVFLYLIYYAHEKTCASFVPC